MSAGFAWAAYPVVGVNETTADEEPSAVVFSLGALLRCLGEGGVAPKVVLREALAALVLFAALVNFLDSWIPNAVGTALSRGAVSAILRFGQFEGDLEGYASRTCVGGNLLVAVAARPSWRSIPARAGEPMMRFSLLKAIGVYPRACGGTTSTSAATRSRSGLSPRVRGNPNADPADGHEPGSIPARAGEPQR